MCSFYSGLYHMVFKTLYHFQEKSTFNNFKDIMYCNHKVNNQSISPYTFNIQYVSARILVNIFKKCFKSIFQCKKYFYKYHVLLVHKYHYIFTHYKPVFFFST